MSQQPASRSSGEDSSADLAASFDPTTQLLLEARAGDRGTLRRAVVVAVVAHILLLMVTVPNLASPKQLGGPKAEKIFVIQNVRFKPPARRQQKEVPERKTKKIPIPDPTPNDPEPLIEEVFEPPEIELSEIGADVFGIPDAPPGPAGEGLGQGPLQLGDGIVPPKKIFDPRPLYTEEARQARVQGTVILQAVVDAQGNVTDVKILKGLPLGLQESAIQTVKTWKYEPATRGGEPVAVYLNLVVNFSLQ
jgi:periplasmic protein TonB